MQGQANGQAGGTDHRHERGGLHADAAEGRDADEGQDGVLHQITDEVGDGGIEMAGLHQPRHAAGLAVGLALQGSLSNFASGVLLILFRPIKVGEFVEVAGTAGVVQTVQIFTTVLTTGDNKMVVVPNGTILNGTITNYSRMETRRVDLSFNLAYDVDLRSAKELLARLVQEDQRILPEPAPVIAVAALTDTAVQIIVRPWVKNGDYWDVFFSLQERASLAFAAEGFKRPLPQVTMVPKG